MWSIRHLPPLNQTPVQRIRPMVGEIGADSIARMEVDRRLVLQRLMQNPTMEVIGRYVLTSVISVMVHIWREIARTRPNWLPSAKKMNQKRRHD